MPLISEPRSTKLMENLSNRVLLVPKLLTWVPIPRRASGMVTFPYSSEWSGGRLCPYGGGFGDGRLVASVRRYPWRGSHLMHPLIGPNEAKDRKSIGTV